MEHVLVQLESGVEERPDLMLKLVDDLVSQTFNVIRELVKTLAKDLHDNSVPRQSVGR